MTRPALIWERYRTRCHRDRPKAVADGSEWRVARHAPCSKLLIFKNLIRRVKGTDTNGPNSKSNATGFQPPSHHRDRRTHAVSAASGHAMDAGISRASLAPAFQISVPPVAVRPVSAAPRPVSGARRPRWPV